MAEINYNVALNENRPPPVDFLSTIGKAQDIRNKQASEGGIRAASDEATRAYEGKMASAKISQAVMKDLVDPKTGRLSYNKFGKPQYPPGHEREGETIDMSNVMSEIGNQLMGQGYVEHGYTNFAKAADLAQKNIKTDDDATNARKKHYDMLVGLVENAPQDQKANIYQQSASDLQKRYPYIHGDMLPMWEDGPEGVENKTITALKAMSMGTSEKSRVDSTLTASGLNPALGDLDGNSQKSKDAVKWANEHGLKVPVGTSFANIMSNPAAKGVFEGYPATIQLSANQRFNTEVSQNNNIADVQTAHGTLTETRKLVQELKNDPTVKWDTKAGVFVNAVTNQIMNTGKAGAINAQLRIIDPSLSQFQVGLDGVDLVLGQRQKVLQNKIDSLSESTSKAVGTYGQSGQGDKKIDFGNTPEQFVAGIKKAEGGDTKYGKVHDNGSMGAYSFLPGTWKDYSNVPFSKATPAEEDAAFKRFTDDNRTKISKKLKIPEEQVTNDMLAYAHHYGPGSVTATDMGYAYNDQLKKPESTKRTSTETALIRDFDKVKSEKDKEVIRKLWSSNSTEPLPENMKPPGPELGTKENPHKPTSEKEVQALKAGDYFVNPDGRVLKKG